MIRLLIKLTIFTAFESRIESICLKNLVQNIVFTSSFIAESNKFLLQHEVYLFLLYTNLKKKGCCQYRAINRAQMIFLWFNVPKHQWKKYKWLIFISQFLVSKWRCSLAGSVHSFNNMGFLFTCSNIQSTTESKYELSYFILYFLEQHDSSADHRLRNARIKVHKS